MKNNGLKFTLLIVVFITISLGFTSIKENATAIPSFVATTSNVLVTVSLEKNINSTLKPPFLGKSFVGFKEAIGFKESQGNYFVVNDYGYLGKYQFGTSTLKSIGIYNTHQFLNNPPLQERAFIANTSKNKWILRNYIKKYAGKKIGGVVVTESGMLAAAHLAGAGNVKKYLRSNGGNGFKDANGASVRYYMKKFSGYDTSFIIAQESPKA